MPVSNLHPVKNVFPEGLTPVSDSERADLGEARSSPFTTGDGVRRSSAKLQAPILGVDGKELDW